MPNYPPIKTKAYLEALLWVILEDLRIRHIEQENKKIIYLNSEQRDKNIVGFDKERQLIFFHQISYRDINNYFINNIGYLNGKELLCYDSKQYFFLIDDLPDNSNKVTPNIKSKNHIKKLLKESQDGKNKYFENDFKGIFTELKNSNIITEQERSYRTSQYFSCESTINLQELNESEIRNFIHQICGIGGRLEESKLLFNQNNQLFIHHEILNNINRWINKYFNCEVEELSNRALEELNNFWINRYPDKSLLTNEILINILDNDNNEPDLELCLCIYKLFVNINSEYIDHYPARFDFSKNKNCYEEK